MGCSLKNIDWFASGVEGWLIIMQWPAAVVERNGLHECRGGCRAIKELVAHVPRELAGEARVIILGDEQPIRP